MLTRADRIRALKATGFAGHNPSHERERKWGQENLHAIPWNNLLPTDAYNAGFELISLVNQRQSSDPYTLYDQWGKILYQWPDDYVPGWLEVAEVCQQFLR